MFSARPCFRRRRLREWAPAWVAQGGLDMVPTARFAFSNTSGGQRAKLALFGFVRVDGMPVPELRHRIDDRMYAAHHELGRHGYNNGKIVIVTPGGEVWLAVLHGDHHRYQELYDELCPNGKGALVPLSEGEQVDSDHLLQRLSDPDWEIGP